MGEVMFSITGLEFSFTQAPASMKSILAAIWLITVAIGNLIVVFFAKLRLFEEQVRKCFHLNLKLFRLLCLFVIIYSYGNT